MRKSVIFLSLALFPLFTLAHGGVNDDELIIRITENGFEPKELTVTDNDTVLFINNGEKEHWPASDLHPTHGVYPAFDPQKGIKPGESWQFTFTQVGTWRMHDHLFPHFTGAIVVLPEPGATPVVGVEPNVWTKINQFLNKLWQNLFTRKVSAQVDEAKLVEFKSLNEREKYTWLEAEAKSESPETAWQYVLAAYQTPAGVVGNPHDMAHLVGQLLFASGGFAGLTTCTPVFAFGCYHGLMQVAFDRTKPREFEGQLEKAKVGCEKVAESTSPSYWSCIHGIGHGIATYRDFDISKSMADCDLFGTSTDTYCRDGVFMEFSTSAPGNFYKPGDPLYPCESISAAYRTACARSQAQVMKTRFGMTNAAVVAACLKSADKNIRYHCTDAIGYAVAQAAGGEAEKVVLGCNAIADKAAARQCLAAAAGELVFQNTAGWQSAVETICKNADETCMARVENVKKSYGRN